MLRRLAILFLATIAVNSAAEKWTPEDVLFQESAGSLEMSRDGRLAVFTKSKMDREKGVAVTNVFLKHIADDFEIALTRGPDGASSPRFAPDSKRVAFLSSRKPPGAPAAAGAGDAGGSQVWLIDVRGGEPWQLTRMEKGVRAFDWLDDGTLLLLAAEDSSLFELANKERKDTTNVLDDEDHASPVRLFRFEIKGSKVTRLTTNTDRITGVTVSPDGAWAVTNHNRSLAETFNQKIKPVTFLHDLKKGTSAQLFAGLKLQARNFNFTRDSRGFYFMAPFSNHAYLMNASVTRIYFYDLAAAAHVEVPLNWERGAGFSYDVTADGFVAVLLDGARNRIARFTRSGASWTRAWLEGEHAANIFSLNTSFDGKTLLYNYTTASKPAVWMRASLDGARLVDPKPLVTANAGWAKKNLAKTEVITWTGALDEQIEGILYYPHHYEAGKRYPLVVMIHGGPHGHDADAFRESWGYPHQLMAQRGAFILKPNYHGSSGYGLKFGESISGGKYNDLEWIDVEKGVDHLIAKGLVDKDKLGVLGWSNGSIITIELTTRTSRYKAAGAGAGNVNWISDWGNAVFGDSFDSYYLGTTPMDNPELYMRKSPLFRMDKVTTPTIIFFGTEDKQVPTEQGWQHYRALQHYGKTDVKFLLFPGEAHGLRRLAFQQRKLEEELRWFDKHLFGTLRDENEALKKESALAAALRVQRLGETPETAERGALHIGRFEVTRAQFKAFDPTYHFAEGTGHYPANNVSFEKAQAYCEWLSKKAGAKYRLGTEEEMGALLSASKSENTLDAWAGYTVNPDDAGRLASLLEGLAPGALLKPVGSYAGKGEDPVYDLGGNVAEWVVAQDGKGKAMGGSADRPVDPKAQPAPRPEYTGFRVVRE